MDQPASPEAAEALCDQLAQRMAKVFHIYIVKQQKKHGPYVFPALLNVCSRLVVAAVRTFPPNEQQQALKEFAALVAQRYSLAGITTPEEKRIITLN